MIAPSAYLQQEAQTDPHAQLQQFLARDEIRAELVRLGVDPAVAQARVQALSDAEAAAAVERMPEMPAGGIIGAIVFIFLVLLITDLLGLTDVYPFVKKHR
jgi:hypothetical protein